MSKGLEALEHIKNNDFDIMLTCYPPIPAYKGVSIEEMYDTIEKELKALEIIKEKEMLSVYKDIEGKCFLVFNTMAIEIPQEEFDLLREVLEQ